MGQQILDTPSLACRLEHPLGVRQGREHPGEVLVSRLQPFDGRLGHVPSLRRREHYPGGAGSTPTALERSASYAGDTSDPCLFVDERTPTSRRGVFEGVGVCVSRTDIEDVTCRAVMERLQLDSIRDGSGDLALSS